MSNSLLCLKTEMGNNSYKKRGTLKKKKKIILHFFKATI